MSSKKKVPTTTAQTESKTIKIEVQSKKKIPAYVTILADIALLVLGICMVMWHGTIIDVISKVIGVIFIVYALYCLIAYIRVEEKRNKDLPMLISAIALTIIGVFFFTQSALISQFISFVVGAFITLVSIFHLQDVLATKAVNKYFKVSLIFTLISLFAGIACIFGKVLIPDLFVIIMGVALIVSSTANIASYIASKIKK